MRFGRSLKIYYKYSMHFELAPEEHDSLDILASEEVRRPIVSLQELEALCGDEEVLKELLAEMVQSCLKYTITVAKWQESHAKNRGEITEDFLDTDKLRTSVHDRTINDINIFSRTLKKFGKDNSFMDKAGMDGKNRAAYGKFALTLTLSRI